jgi:hypothetical protein
MDRRGCFRRFRNRALPPSIIGRLQARNACVMKGPPGFCAGHQYRRINPPTLGGIRYDKPIRFKCIRGLLMVCLLAVTADFFLATALPRTSPKPGLAPALSRYHPSATVAVWWLADERTLAAAVRYLLEPEPGWPPSGQPSPLAPGLLHVQSQNSDSPGPDNEIE